MAAQPKAADEPAATADGFGRDLAAAEFERTHKVPARPIGLLFDAEDGTTE